MINGEFNSKDRNRFSELVLIKNDPERNTEIIKLMESLQPYYNANLSFAQN